MAEEKRGLFAGLQKGFRGMFERTGLAEPKAAEPVSEKAPIPIRPLKVPPYETDMGWYPHRIKFRGLCDLDRLYKTMVRWLKDKRFEFHETLYKSKPPELEIRWECERKATSFVMERVVVYFHMWGDYNVEVIEQGKKKTMANVRMFIEVNGDIRAPYSDLFGEQQWTANAVERRLMNVFKNWIYRRELEGLYWDKLYYELYDLLGLIKTTLKMEAK